mgnify:CR=1 FL=1
MYIKTYTAEIHQNKFNKKINTTKSTNTSKQILQKIQQ